MVHSNCYSVWKIKELVAVLDQFGALTYLNHETDVPQVLAAFDQGQLPKFVDDHVTHRFVDGYDVLRRNLMHLKAPVSAGMMTAGKGVDTRSKEDRNVEFEVGGLRSAVEGETPYDWIYQGGRDPQLLRALELFLKVPGSLVTGPFGVIGRRRLAKVVKPEAEFCAVLAPGSLNPVGWTLGNDQTVNVGGHDGTEICAGEAENTLLLPQAKVFRHCTGIGPCIILSKEDPAKDMSLTVRIIRDRIVVCEQSMQFGDYMRNTKDVVDGFLRPAWGDLFALQGGILMLGTGTRIPDGASLLPFDFVEMECPMFPMKFLQVVVEVP